MPTNPDARPADDDTPLNPTLTRLLRHCGFDRRWVRGEGAWLEDDRGRRFLDFYAQYGAVALGHNAKAVTEAVQAALLAREPAMVQPYEAPHAAALARELCRLTGQQRCVFTSSGAEAVEAAIKLVRTARRRPLLVSAEGSYHGKTMGALAATGQRRHHEPDALGPPGFVHIPYGDAAALEALLMRDAEQVAGVLLEPIQGERGVYLPPPGYLAAVRALCDRYGVPLILDEIQTGLGRTGRLLAAEHEGVQPDVLLLSKALGGGLFPLGACLCRADLWDPEFAFRHSSTFANNNVAGLVGLAVLRELTGGLCQEAAALGAVLQERLWRLAARYPQVVAAVRSRGLYGAVELAPVPPESGLFLTYFQHQGLLAYAVSACLAERAGVLMLPTLGGGQVLRLAPPLVVTEAEVHLALDGLESVCADLSRGDGAALARDLGALRDVATDPRRRVTLPPWTLSSAEEPAQQRGPAQARYAFLIHYTRPQDVATTNPSFTRLSGEDLQRFCGFVSVLPAGVALRTAPLRSATGAWAAGHILALPMLPMDMARLGRRGVADEICRAVDLAAALGAEIVGLGGATTPYSRHGLAVTGRGPAITTGNTLTAVMAVRALLRAAERRGVRLAEATVGVVGARGSVGALCARLLLRAGAGRLLLLGNPASPPSALEGLREELGSPAVAVGAELGALAGCGLILSAVGAPRPVLARAPVRPGAIVCDVARPGDAPPSLRARADVTVIDGGLVALPDPQARFGPGNLQGLPDGVQLACLSETILLALDGARRDFGVGDDIPLAAAERIEALAALHGFGLAEAGAGPAAADVRGPCLDDAAR